MCPRGVSILQRILFSIFSIAEFIFQYHDLYQHAVGRDPGRGTYYQYLRVWMGGGGGSGIHCSLNIYPIIRLIKILGYSLK